MSNINSIHSLVLSDLFEKTLLIDSSISKENPPIQKSTHNDTPQIKNTLQTYPLIKHLIVVKYNHQDDIKTQEKSLLNNIINASKLDLAIFYIVDIDQWNDTYLNAFPSLQTVLLFGVNVSTIDASITQALTHFIEYKHPKKNLFYITSPELYFFIEQTAYKAHLWKALKKNWQII